MTFVSDLSVTGGAQTGFTTPVWVLTADTPPNSYSKQYACTSFTGTVGTARAHSASDPFTVTMERPASFKTPGTVNPATGQLGNVQRNVYTFRVRKGVKPLAGQSPQTMQMEMKISIPAGADSADADNIRAALSLLIGQLNEQSAGIGDALVTGVL
jgi:hypothetical protein